MGEPWEGGEMQGNFHPTNAQNIPYAAKREERRREMPAEEVSKRKKRKKKYGSFKRGKRRMVVFTEARVLAWASYAESWVKVTRKKRGRKGRLAASGGGIFLENLRTTAHDEEAWHDPDTCAFSFRPSFGGKPKGAHGERKGADGPMRDINMNAEDELQ